MFNCCSHGTLLHFGLQSSRLNICYYHQDLHLRRLHPGPRPRLQGSPQRPSYSSRRSVRGARRRGGETRRAEGRRGTGPRHAPPTPRDAHPRPLPSRSVPTAGDGRVWARRSSAIHFQGYLIRQVSCHTLLSVFRLPWPTSCFLYQPTPFLGSDERRHRAP